MFTIDFFIIQTLYLKMYVMNDRLITQSVTYWWDMTIDEAYKMH